MPRGAAPGEFRLLAVGLFAADSLALAAASALAFFLRYGDVWPGQHPRPTASAVVLEALMPIVALSLFAALRLYEVDSLFAGHREYEGVARACTYAAFAVLVLSFLTVTPVARGAILAAWLLSIILAGAQRFVLRRAVFWLRKRGHFVRRLLVVGTDEHAVAIARQFQSAPECGLRVVGFLDDYRPVGAEILSGLRVLGDPCSASEAAAQCGASTLVVVLHAVSWESQRHLLELAASDGNLTVQLAPGLYHLLATGIRTIDNGLVPLMVLGRLRITGLDALLKATIDYGGATVLLTALAPAVILCALARMVDRAGPLWERERVLGLQGETFNLFMLARPLPPEPPRLLRWWAWRLRSTVATSRMGKLPNLLNVLRGRMSLVGPRALVESERVMPQPWVSSLLLVRPGLTGPTAGPNGRASPEEQAIKDVAYVREYSLWLDLRLLFASAKRVVRREHGLPPSYGSAIGQEPAPARVFIP